LGRLGGAGPHFTSGAVNAMWLFESCAIPSAAITETSRITLKIFFMTTSY